MKTLRITLAVALLLVALLLIPCLAWSASVQSVIAWGDVANETGYRVERQVDGGTWSVLGTVAADMLSYVDPNEPLGANLCFRITAYNALGDGPPSDPACTATPTTPPKPGGISVTTTIIP